MPKIKINLIKYGHNASGVIGTTSLSFMALFFFIGSLQILPQSPSGNIDLFSPGNRVAFGNYLFCQDDYLRAVREYQEYLRSGNNDTVRFKVAEAFLNMNRYTEAADNFKGLFFSSSLQDEAKLGFYKANFLKGDYKNFRTYIGNITYFPDVYSTEIQRLRFLTYLLDDSALPDSIQLLSLFKEEDKESIDQFYTRKKHPGYKSPLTAALLSAVVPGLGKLYADEYGDGITAFIFTGILTFLAIDNFNADHQFRGWLFTGLAALFYGGNVYGSAAAVQSFNAGIKINFDKDLKFHLGQKNYYLPVNDFLCN